MRTLRRLYLTVCCLGLLGMAVAWPRTYRQGDGLIVNGDHGRAFGIKRTPGEVFISSTRDKKNDPASLRLRTTKYFRCPPNGPTIFDRYIIYTHRALEGDPSGSALAIVLPSYPTVATRWAVPGIRAQGGTFNGIDYEQIVVSFWLITCALAIAPPITCVPLAARVARRRHRRPHGQFLHC